MRGEDLTEGKGWRENGYQVVGTGWTSGLGGGGKGRQQAEKKGENIKIKVRVA